MVSVRWAVITVVCAAGVLFVSSTASASCAGQPTPSPHAFVGTVERTESAGRLAAVLTEGGREVEVRGGETREGVAASNDRTYDVGSTYEFHPVNAASPFQDNACTATRLLASAGELPARSVGDQPAGKITVPEPGSGEPAPRGAGTQPIWLGAPFLLAGVLAVMLHRSRTRHHRARPLP